MHTAIPLPVPCKRAPWNKGRLIGLRVPVDRDHGFRWKLITQSGGT
jgi:hypothetical protein